MADLLESNLEERPSIALLDFELQAQSSPDWLNAVSTNFDTFILDHAANERKASSMAMSMVAHYPDRVYLCSRLIDLAIEELTHFKQVMRLVYERGLNPGADVKDPYVNQLRSFLRKPSNEFLLDRLLLGAVIEARGAERFGQLANILDDPELARFYRSLQRSEAKHHLLFLDIADQYFTRQDIEKRLQEWLTIEAEVLKSLPAEARLH